MSAGPDFNYGVKEANVQTLNQYPKQLYSRV